MKKAGGIVREGRNGRKSPTWLVSAGLICLVVWAIFACGEEALYGFVHVRPAVAVKEDWQNVHALGTRIRLVTYNIQDFADGIDDGTNRTPEQAQRHAFLAADILARIDGDVVILQEIENPAALELLQSAFRTSYPLAYVTDFQREGERALNIAVLSRLPVYAVRTIDFGGLQGILRPPRGALSFLLPLESRRLLLIYGVHLKSNFGELAKNCAKRYYAMKILREDIQLTVQRFPGFQWEIAVLGDMNVDPDDPQFADDYSLEPFAEWVDLWRGRPLSERVTVPTRYGDPALEFPPRTFDRILVAPELVATPWRVLEPQVLQTGVDTQNVFTVGGQNDMHVSDHYPVFVDLER